MTAPFFVRHLAEHVSGGYLTLRQRPTCGLQFVAVQLHTVH